MRTNESEKKYKEYRQKGGLDDGCRLCEAPALQEFEHWKVIENKFPYDMIADTHNMVVPRAHHSVKEISAEAWAEYNMLKYGPLGAEYDFFIEATPNRLSIPTHFHLHLVVLKKFE